MQTREYRVIGPTDLTRETASQTALIIAGRLRDVIVRKWRKSVPWILVNADELIDGTKREVVVRILFPSTGITVAMVKIVKMKPWNVDEERLADRIMGDLLPEATLVEGKDRSKDVAWAVKQDVYTGTAVDETWRSWFGLSGGKPWASSKRP